jgi:hypothetical protein
MIEAWRGTGSLVWRPPIIYEGRRRRALQHRTGEERRAGAKQTESSDPMREADAPSTEEATLAHRVGARPTGGSHGLTTDAPAQRSKGAKLKAARKEEEKSAAKGSIKAGAP